MVYPALLPLMRTPRLPVVDCTDAPRPIEMDSSVSPKDEICFLRVCYHISAGLYKFLVWLLIMNGFDDGVIDKFELVTWTFVNCIVPDGGLNIYIYFEFRGKIVNWISAV